MNSHCEEGDRARRGNLNLNRCGLRNDTVIVTSIDSAVTTVDVSSASRLGGIYGIGLGRSIPRRRRLSLSENGNPFVRFADISPIRGISHCHFVTSPQRGAPLPYKSNPMILPRSSSVKPNSYIPIYGFYFFFRIKTIGVVS